MVFLLILSAIIGLWCGWKNYFRAEKYKGQRDVARKKLKQLEYREMNEMAIMLYQPHGAFHPERQN